MIEARPRDRADLDKIAEALSGFDPRPRTDAAAGSVAIGVDEGTARLVDVARHLDELGLAVEDLSLRRPTLDEVFLNLTGKGELQ
jgi:ABC-2 type transport system ATP-binding protein